MCNCNKTIDCHPCQQPKPCGDCAVKINTNCITYNGSNLTCSTIQSGTNLNDVIKTLEAKVCETNTLETLTNIGSGAEIYAGKNNLGQSQLRTLVSANSNIVISEQDDTITFNAPSSTDTYTVSGVLNPSTGVVTFTRNDSTNYTVNLSVLLTDVYTTSASINTTTGLVTFTRNDASTYNLSLASLLNVQPDVLQNTTTSNDYIKNKNASRQVDVTTSYAVVTSDNNQVLLINNGSNNVTIDLSGSLPTSDFFVGFIQKGTGTVTFSGAGSVPQGLTANMFGQGHNAALEIIGGVKYIFGSLDLV